MRKFLTRIAGFTTLPIIAALLPLLALPVAARVASTSEWTALLVAQAIGGYAGCVIYSGWNVMGTPRVAVMKLEDQRHKSYAESVSQRMLVAAVVIPIAATVGVVVSPPSTFALVVTVVVAWATTGLGIGWFAVGISSPRVLARFEVLPRVMFTLASIPLMMLTADLIWYPAAFLLGSIAGLLLFHWDLFRSPFSPWSGFSQVARTTIENRHAWAVEVVGNLHASAPTPIASAVAPPMVAAGFASGDRLYRYSLISVSALGNALQGWVLEMDRNARGRRIAISLYCHAALGLVGFAALSLIGPLGTSILFGSRFEASPLTMFYFGIAFFALSVATPLMRNILMPEGAARTVLVGTILGVVIGIPTMLLAATELGVSGVALGLAASEITVLLTCTIGVLIVRRTTK